MNDTLEAWLPIDGYEGHYEVSSYGNVRSVDRIIEGPGGRGRSRVLHKRKGRLKRLSNGKDGYKLVSLCKHGKEVQYRVHRLVATAFLGQPPSGAWEVNHIDGNPQNNAIRNLEWVTASGNQRHALKRPKYEYQGRFYSMVELAEISGLPYSAVRTRIKSLGWSVEKALTTARRLLPNQS